MHIVFAGTPDFARIAYEALLDAGHQVSAVLTQPDRPAGRGMKLQASAVKQSALLHGAEVLQPLGLKLDGKFSEHALSTKRRLEELAPDVIVVAAYGLILPQWVLALPRFGCLNIHASLLPRWRGAAPIQRAIEAGDQATGVTIMQMDEGLDTGAMWLSESIPISAKSTAHTLHDELSALGAKLIVEALDKIPLGALTLTPQPEDGVTYAAKLEKSESNLDFSQPAEQLARRIRAFDPVPGSTFFFSPLNQQIKVWAAHVADYSSSAQPGVIVNTSFEGIDIATSDGVLRLTELQKAGAKRQTVDVFVRGLNLA